MGKGQDEAIRGANTTFSDRMQQEGRDRER